MPDPYYRLYTLDHAGVIRGASSRAFTDDIEALDHAGALLSAYPAVEVWQTDRLVGRVARTEAEPAWAMSA